MSFGSEPSPERESSAKIAARLEEIKEQVPANQREQVTKEINEYKCIRILLDYSDKVATDPSGLPSEVREMMTERNLDFHNNLASAAGDWMEKFEPWYDMRETYGGWTTAEFDQLINGLK